MKKILLKLFPSHRPKELPKDMRDMRGSDPCWCGSEMPYRKCHRSEDRRREKELGLNRRSKSVCDAFT